MSFFKSTQHQVGDNHDVQDKSNYVPQHPLLRQDNARELVYGSENEYSSEDEYGYYSEGFIPSEGKRTLSDKAGRGRRGMKSFMSGKKFSNRFTLPKLTVAAGRKGSAEKKYKRLKKRNFKLKQEREKEKKNKYFREDEKRERKAEAKRIRKEAERIRKEYREKRKKQEGKDRQEKKEKDKYHNPWVSNARQSQKWKKLQEERELKATKVAEKRKKKEHHDHDHGEHGHGGDHEHGHKEHGHKEHGHKEHGHKEHGHKEHGHHEKVNEMPLQWSDKTIEQLLKRLKIYELNHPATVKGVVVDHPATVKGVLQGVLKENHRKMKENHHNHKKRKKKVPKHLCLDKSMIKKGVPIYSRYNH